MAVSCGFETPAVPTCTLGSRSPEMASNADRLTLPMTVASIRSPVCVKLPLPLKADPTRYATCVASCPMPGSLTISRDISSASSAFRTTKSGSLQGLRIPFGLVSRLHGRQPSNPCQTVKRQPSWARGAVPGPFPAPGWATSSSNSTWIHPRPTRSARSARPWRRHPRRPAQITARGA